MSRRRCMKRLKDASDNASMPAGLDVDYGFVYIDAECLGRISDGGDFRNSILKAVLAE